MRLITALLAVSTLHPHASFAAAPVTLYYVDLDGDGFGSGDGIESSAPEPGWVTIDGDCLPMRPDDHPGANEICDGLDNDCDGMVDDDDDSVDRSTFRMFWADADGDRYGDNAISTRACRAPSGYVTQRDDCDDGDATIHPWMPEYCDGKDNDCDGAIDDAVYDDAVSYVDWYRDQDGDGFGTDDDVQNACAPVDGYVTRGGDCDDLDADIGPRARDICANGIDEDCDGVADNCTIVEPDFVLNADTNHLELGGRLTTPDLNGDGVADLVASNLVVTNVTVKVDEIRGGASGVFGPVTGTMQVADADVAIMGRADGECVRPDWDVSSGDANGDGQDDLLVSAACLDTAYLMLGPITADRHTDRADATLVYNDLVESFGLLNTTAISPDVDGDGGAELLIAAPYLGAVYVVSAASSGTVDLSVDATYQFNGEGYLGFNAFHDVGDTNGDGVTDLAIGAFDAGREGKVYVVEGGAAPGTYDVDAAASATVTGGDRSATQFGRIVTAADYDGDGTSDLIVGDNDRGALWASPELASVFAFLGPLEGDAYSGDADTTWISNRGAVYVGGGLAVGGDVDGDGSADMIVGTDTEDGGAVFVQLGWGTGRIVLTDLPSIRALGRNYNLGSSVAFLSDWSGDGADEIAAGDPLASTAGPVYTAGAVYVAFSDQLF